MDKSQLQIFTKNYLEGNLSRAKELELLSWVKSSESNKYLFLKTQQSLAKATSENDNQLIHPNWKNLQKRLIPIKNQNRFYVLFLKTSSLAATFILGVVLTFLIISDYYSPKQQVAQIQNITVPFGAKTNITLPDGSLVWLNSGSSLSYPTMFENNRPVVLSGEAFFEVEKNGKPFIVSTKYGDVEVMGTSFNVCAFDDDKFRTTLVTGSVKIKESNTKNEVTLRPGQQAIKEGHQFNILNVETDLFTSWKDGKLIFRKEFLPAVAKRLERWYNVKIELANDNHLSSIWYSGTLEMESFSEVLELLKVTAPIDYTYNEKTRTIKIIYKPI